MLYDFILIMVMLVIFYTVFTLLITMNNEWTAEPLNTTAILTHTFDGYKRYWGGFFHFYNKYYPVLYWPTYFANENMDLDTFKDTTIYGQLLAENFVFIYFDYDLELDVSWDRVTDMKTTYGLFTNTQDLKLVWNNIVFQDGDSLNLDVKRSFNLSIIFNPNDVINFYGFVDMTLSRASSDDKWRLKRWRDLTNP